MVTRPSLPGPLLNLFVTPTTDGLSSELRALALSCAAGLVPGSRLRWEPALLLSLLLLLIAAAGDAGAGAGLLMLTPAPRRCVAVDTAVIRSHAAWPSCPRTDPIYPKCPNPTVQTATSSRPPTQHNTAGLHVGRGLRGYALGRPAWSPYGSPHSCTPPRTGEGDHHPNLRCTHLRSSSGSSYASKIVVFDFLCESSSKRDACGCQRSVRGFSLFLYAY